MLRNVRKYNLKSTVDFCTKNLVFPSDKRELFLRLVEYVKTLEKEKEKDSHSDAEANVDFQDIVTIINSSLENTHEIFEWCRVAILDHIF